jgi:hypothetical protein
MKEAACYVSLDFKDDLEKTWKGTRGERRPDYLSGAGIARDYVLPDSHTRFHGVVREYEPGVSAKARKGAPSTEDILTLRNERFVVPELLFHPSDIGMRQPGLGDLVMQSLSVLPSAYGLASWRTLWWSAGMRCSKTSSNACRRRYWSECLTPALFAWRAHRTLSRVPGWVPRDLLDMSIAEKLW